MRKQGPAKSLIHASPPSSNAAGADGTWVLGLCCGRWIHQVNPPVQRTTQHDDALWLHETVHRLPLHGPGQSPTSMSCWSLPFITELRRTRVSGVDGHPLIPRHGFGGLGLFRALAQRGRVRGHTPRRTQTEEMYLLTDLPELPYLGTRTVGMYLDTHPPPASHTSSHWPATMERRYCMYTVLPSSCTHS
jgi:hypothetical protein